MKKLPLLLLGLLFVAIAGQASETKAKVWDPAITTTDGHKLRCTYHQPRTDKLNVDARGVILVHMLGGKKTDWNLLPKKLSKAGFAVLVLELRGHNDRLPEEDSWKQYEKKQFAEMYHDILAAKKWLLERKKVHVKKVAVCGARFGANLALTAMKHDNDLLAGYCLSAGESYRQLKVDYSLDDIKDRPVKLVTSEEDIYGSICLEKFKKQAGSDIETQLLEKNDSDKDIGTELLLSRKDLEDEIVSWLKEKY